MSVKGELLVKRYVRGKEPKRKSMGNREIMKHFKLSDWN